MTPEQIKEAIALEIGKMMVDPTAPIVKATAAAVMALVGPKPLQFADETGDGVLTSLKARTFYRCFPQENGSFFVSHCGFYPTLEAAQSAAQAHADAAHWANTALGAMIGGG